MKIQNWYQNHPWLRGLIWGWTLFSILTFIDYWNGALNTERLPLQFAVWSIAGAIKEYLTGYFTKPSNHTTGRHF